MRRLAAFAMRSRVHAAGVAAALVAAGWVLPLPLILLNYVSGGILALAVLRQGAGEGFKVAGLASGCAVLAAALALRSPVAGMLVALGLWGPVWCAALVLRATASQGRLVIFAGMLGLLLDVGMRLQLGDVNAWWLHRFQELLSAARADGAQITVTADQLQTMAALTTGLSAASMAVSITLMVFLGRGWQAMLYNPGGFGREFRTLTLPLGGVAAFAALALLLVLGWERPAAGGPLMDMAMLLLALYALQGLALAHHQVAAMGVGIGWLVGLYVLIFLALPYAGLGLAVAGAMDAVFDVRHLRQRVV